MLRLLASKLNRLLSLGPNGGGDRAVAESVTGRRLRGYATVAAKATIEAAATNKDVVAAMRDLVWATLTIALVTIVAAIASIGLVVFT